MRDNQGKILTPLVMIKRNSVTRRDDVPDFKASEVPEMRLTVIQKYSKDSKYNSIFNKSPNSRNVYSIDIPKFVQIEYDLLIWTNTTEQLNSICEQIYWYDGKAFGNNFKFTTYIDPPVFEVVNSIGDDRINRATMQLRTKAAILAPKGPNAPGIYQIPDINKIKINTTTT